LGGAGASDINHNDTNNGLRSVLEFVEQHKHTNIVLIQAPHWHDLREWSCINVERKKYNRKLIKLMKNQRHVTVMNVDFERECFTSHGLHMNGKGKTRIAQHIAHRCKQIPANEKILPIPMTWTLHQNDISKSVQNVELVNNCNSNSYTRYGRKVMRLIFF
jgi:hypothetical protein